MEDKNSTTEIKTEDSSPISTNEKGSRNKRKFLSDLSQEIPVDLSTLSLTQFPKYEPIEEKKESEDSGWDESIACQLHDLLTSNLLETFRSAIQKISEFGHTKESSEWAVLSSGLYHGTQDVVTNVVDGALSLLKREKEVNMSKVPLFENLPSLVNYTILEMIYVLQEVRPNLTMAEAMWYLLISDLNLVNACVADGEREIPVLTISRSKIDEERDKFDCPRQAIIGRDGLIDFRESNGKKFSGIISREQIESLAHAVEVLEEHSVSSGCYSSKKGSVCNSSKRELLLRQKAALTFERGYKGGPRMSKGAFKAKVAALGSMVLDKSLKKESKSKSKSNSLPSNEITISKSTNTAIDYYSLIPYDETLKKHVPVDEKDETILALVPYKEKLEKEVLQWTDWANAKVMQATRRLQQDQSELKTLRREVEEVEKFKREVEGLENNTLKRLSEMENASSNAAKQMEAANLTVRKLEEENYALSKDMEAARMKAVGSANRLQEAVVREQETVKKSHELENDKGVFVEEAANLKRRIAELENRIEKAKGRVNQFKILSKQEEKEKERISSLIKASLEKREKDVALTELEAKSIHQIAESNLQKCKEDINTLEEKISKMRFESNQSKIAALNVGFGKNASHLPKVTKRLAVFRDNFGAGNNVKQERECVVCLSDEASVVFLPCKHQVLCKECNQTHEKRGAKDCPSCRRMIQKRIHVKFRGDWSCN